jgi:MFS family permease
MPGRSSFTRALQADQRQRLGLATAGTAPGEQAAQSVPAGAAQPATTLETSLETHMANPTEHQSHDTGQAKKATASGWIGSVLEYYDFFIYATAASLIFPQIFFPKGDPKTAIVASLATYGVGYVARPIGAFFLGHWGDTRGRKHVLLICMFLMGISTMAVGLLPTYNQVGMLAPVLLVILRLIQGFAVAGEISGASSMICEHAPFGRRGYYSSFTLQGVQFGQILAAAVFLPLAHYMSEDAFNSWGWRIPFLLSFVVIIAGYLIRRNVEETPVFREEAAEGARPKSPVVDAVRESWRDMLRVVCMALMNVIPVVTSIFGAAYAVQPGYGIGFSKDVYLWIPVLGNIVAVLVIPYVGNLSDKIGRKPLIIGGALLSGLLSFGYLYAISIHNVTLAVAMSLLMWGVVYQGYNAVFPAFYPELFPARTRVSAMAISQNLGTLVTAMLPALFATVAPPGAANIPLMVGAITFGVTVIAALAALSARETYRVRIRDLGEPNAVPMEKSEYEQMRAQASAGMKAHA